MTPADTQAVQALIDASLDPVVKRLEGILAHIDPLGARVYTANGSLALKPGAVATQLGYATPADVTHKAAVEEVAKRARKLACQRNIGYQQARSLVLDDDEVLARAYAETIIEDSAA